MAQKQISIPAAAPTCSDHNEQMVLAVERTLPVKSGELSNGIYI